MKSFFQSESYGVICALLLVILLCQSKIFNFLIDTFLGKIILIAFIIYLSFLHKILGVVVILFIIIIFNNNISFTEGMVNNSNSNDISKKNNKKKNNIENKLNDKLEDSPNDNNIEGFDVIGVENNIKRGKESNSIPVDPFMGVSNNVLPFEGSTLVESFTAYN